MKPTITQREALFLGLTAGVQTSGIIATILLVVAHLFGSQLSWYFPALTCALAIAAKLRHSILIDSILRTHSENRADLLSKK